MSTCVLEVIIHDKREKPQKKNMFQNSDKYLPPITLNYNFYWMFITCLPYNC